MKNILLALISLLLLASCEQKRSTKNFILTGNIKGLKKGTLYIQRIVDTTLVPLDTIKINGDSHFTSDFDLKSPEMLYLFLDRGVTNSLDNNISFFAEPGAMNLETSLDFFTADVKITGSKNQALYDEYRKVIARYNERDLDLVQLKYNAYKEKNTAEVEKIQAKQNALLKQKYLYTTNFAVNNGEYEVAPYLAVTDIYNINLKYLVTIQKRMSTKVAKSLYGKELNAYISERRKLE